jgi:hypothetical protein
VRRKTKGPGSCSELPTTPDPFEFLGLTHLLPDGPRIVACIPMRVKRESTGRFSFSFRVRFPRGRRVRAHGPRVTAVQIRVRCGSIKADLATTGPQATPETALACRTDPRYRHWLARGCRWERSNTLLGLVCPVHLVRCPVHLARFYYAKFVANGVHDVGMCSWLAFRCDAIRMNLKPGLSEGY